MDDLLNIISSFVGLALSWLRAIFSAVEVPFIITICFIVFVRFVMMPAVDLCLRKKDLKKP